MTDRTEVFDYPACLIGGSIDDARSLPEAVHCARIELDLIEEGEEAADNYSAAEVRQIRRWIDAFSAR